MFSNLNATGASFMSKRCEPVKTFLGQLRQAARQDQAEAMDAFIHEMLMKYLGSPDMLSMLYDIKFAIELGHERVSALIQPEKIPELLSSMEPIRESLVKAQKFVVLREYSHTDRRHLWSVESRQIACHNNAIDWQDFMDSESNGKRKHFVAFVVENEQES